MATNMTDSKYMDKKIFKRRAFYLLLWGDMTAEHKCEADITVMEVSGAGFT